MQTGKLLEKTKPNSRFMTWLWHHHWRSHYSYDVIRVTRSSTILYLHYFIIKCNLFIKILQRGKNTKNMKFVQNYKFPKIFKCFQQNSHCRTCEGCRTLKISQNMGNTYKLKVTKTQPTPVYTFWNFSKSLSGGGRGVPPPPPQSGNRVKILEISYKMLHDINHFVNDFGKLVLVGWMISRRCL